MARSNTSENQDDRQFPRESRRSSKSSSEPRTAQGCLRIGSGNYTLINPVSITQRDGKGHVRQQIQAVRASTAGRLTASGGSNGYRVRLFHEQLWKLAHWLGIPIRVAHLPSYCSKYNPIDHRLFCHVSRSLKGVIFRSIETVRDAIARTTTSTGLKVKVSVLKRIYQRGVQASEAFLMGNYLDSATLSLDAGVSRAFSLDRLDPVWVDPHGVVGGDACFTMTAARLGVAPLVIVFCPG